MPVVECDQSESRAIDCELWVDLISQRALEDRARALKAEGLWERACALFNAAATRRKHSTLSFIVSSRAMPDGTRASLPADYQWLRDPQGDRLLIVWGDVFEDAGIGRVELRPYVPLARFVESGDDFGPCRKRQVDRDPDCTGVSAERFESLDLTTVDSPARERRT